MSILKPDGVQYMIISTGRAASTAIYRYLDIAGFLNLPKEKEPHYWCNIPNYPGIYNLIWEIYTPDEQDYLKLYQNSKIILDASCGYFFYLDDVIQKLTQSQQPQKMPKVIFLYREPISRALSWYNERKRKNLTNAEDVVADIKSVPAPGLWWEHYYDNVLYATRFCQLQEYFDAIVAVNYDYFARQPKAVIAELLAFLNIAPNGLENLTCVPVNSSQETLAQGGLIEISYLRTLGSHLPVGLKRWLSNQLVRHRGLRLKKKQLEQYYQKPDMTSLLPISVTEYKQFREQISNQDLYFFSRS